MNYQATIHLKKTTFKMVNDLLSIADLDDLFENEHLLPAKKDDFIGLSMANFENGNSISIDVCSGQTNYYDNCVLRDKNNHEITVFDCSYCIEEEMEFQYGSDTYIIRLELVE